MHVEACDVAASGAYYLAAAAHAIFAEAALSYLGVGVPPPTPSLGNMLGEQNAQSFKPPWWLVVYPGVAITLIILAANLVGDGLRDYLDPRLKGRGLGR